MTPEAEKFNGCSNDWYYRCIRIIRNYRTTNSWSVVMLLLSSLLLSAFIFYAALFTEDIDDDDDHNDDMDGGMLTPVYAPISS